MKLERNQIISKPKKNNRSILSCTYEVLKVSVSGTKALIVNLADPPEYFVVEGFDADAFDWNFGPYSSNDKGDAHRYFNDHAAKK